MNCTTPVKRWSTHSIKGRTRGLPDAHSAASPGCTPAQSHARLCTMMRRGRCDIRTNGVWVMCALSIARRNSPQLDRESRHRRREWHAHDRKERSQCDGACAKVVEAHGLTMSTKGAQRRLQRAASTFAHCLLIDIIRDESDLSKVVVVTHVALGVLCTHVGLRAFLIVTCKLALQAKKRVRRLVLARASVTVKQTWIEQARI